MASGPSVGSSAGGGAVSPQSGTVIGAGSYATTTQYTTGTGLISSRPRFRWKADVEKSVVIQAFERRGWQRAEGEDWHVYWAGVQSVKQIFNPDTGYRLGDNQLVNHYPNHYELTRKDLMVKNIKRYLKELNRGTTTTQQEFVPVTYLLPTDYSLFVEEFRRNPNTMWIMKPTGKAQGRGIFIINKLTQVKKWSNTKWAASNMPMKEAYVISRYIEDPLLIGGKKFDLRIYVLITSYRPLRVYQYCHGFARFCHVKYSNDTGELDNPFIHLTNVAVQKHNEEYNARHGGKWDLQSFRLFIEGTWGMDQAARLFDDIDNIILHSIKAVQGVMINDRHCFECYGYDIIIDSRLKPWLVEVNASPSLTTTTGPDKVLKTSLIRDMLDILIPAHHRNNPTDFRAGMWSGPCRDTGGFVVLYDEEAEREAERQKDPDGQGLKGGPQHQRKVSVRAEWR